MSMGRDLPRPIDGPRSTAAVPTALESSLKEPVMRTLLNVATAACLLALAGVNLAWNRLLPPAHASGSPCEGTPPCADCECCTDCGCWVCACDESGEHEE